jgi:hypothetical protein
MTEADNSDRLFVSVLGNRNSGKTFTWNTLFGSTVRTGKYARRLELRPGRCVEVFLISGSNEERDQYAGDVLEDQACRIILCSMQYTPKVSDTIDYVEQKGFHTFTQWLNPGHHDPAPYTDHLGIVERLLDMGTTIGKRSGKVPADKRVQEIREFVHGWALHRGLVFPC